MMLNLGLFTIGLRFQVCWYKRSNGVGESESWSEDTIASLSFKSLQPVQRGSRDRAAIKLGYVVCSNMRAIRALITGKNRV